MFGGETTDFVAIVAHPPVIEERDDRISQERMLP